MANDLWVFSSSLSAYMRAASGGSSVGLWCLENVCVFWCFSELECRQFDVNLFDIRDFLFL